MSTPQFLSDYSDHFCLQNNNLYTALDKFYLLREVPHLEVEERKSTSFFQNNSSLKIVHL